MSYNRHENYEILYLIGYGLAKFDIEIVQAFGFETKTAFYRNIISKGIADKLALSRTGRICLILFLTISDKAGGRKAMPICTEKHSLTHYL